MGEPFNQTAATAVLRFRTELAPPRRGLTRTIPETQMANTTGVAIQTPRPVEPPCYSRRESKCSSRIAPCRNSSPMLIVPAIHIRTKFDLTWRFEPPTSESGHRATGSRGVLLAVLCFWLLRPSRSQVQQATSDIRKGSPALIAQISPREISCVLFQRRPSQRPRAYPSARSKTPTAGCLGTLSPWPPRQPVGRLVHSASER